MIMTRQEAFLEINRTQDQYVDELIERLEDRNYQDLKVINFTSPTGTGKTMMMSKLIDKLPDNKYFFIITTLSKGQLHDQVRDSLQKNTSHNNFVVFGSCDYKTNSRLKANDIMSLIPEGSYCIWIRDEGHIHTNKFDEVLMDKCYKVINFSATNKDASGVQCNFAHTMMLRTVHQQTGTPEDAIFKLLEVKDAHKFVNGYNPCAIFRCISDNLLQRIIKLCEDNFLKYINITEENFNMSDLCEDDNEYDVIINKFKIVEGIDIRRAHVLYLDNKPGNVATTIQVIGRCRRNALLYRSDVDILSKENKKLLEETRQCYIYYNVENMKVDSDESGELQSAFCEIISVQQLKPNIQIQVNGGKLANGLIVRELHGLTGKFDIIVDTTTGFNRVAQDIPFYKTETEDIEKWFYFCPEDARGYYKISATNIKRLPICEVETGFNYATCEAEKERVYDLRKILPYCTEYVQFPLDDISWVDDVVHKLEQMYADIPVRTKFQHNELISNNGKAKNCDALYTTMKKELGFDPPESVRYAFVYLFHKCNLIYSYRVKRILEMAFKYNTHGERYLWALARTSRKNSSIFDADFKAFNTGLDCEELHKKFYRALFTIHEDTITLQNIKNIKNNCFDLLENKYLSETDVDYFKQILLEIKNNNAVTIRHVVNKYFVKIAYSEYSNGIGSHSLMIDAKYKAVVPEKEVLQIQNAYTKIINDTESSIVGFDTMRPITENGSVIFIEDKSVTSKVKKYTKLNRFISCRYESELEEVKSKLFSGKNNFGFSKKCNSCLGYCVEYYSKFLLYGEHFLDGYIQKALFESHCYDEVYQDIKNVPIGIIIRACMLKYKDMMCRAYGEKVSKLIKCISTTELIKDSYREFCKAVVQLGQRTADFVRANMYTGTTVDNSTDPNLSICHISGLCDYITQDTILDVKVQNKIDIAMVKQVLAYHYLSTKRSDLNIKRVIVYDAVSNRSVCINIMD